MTQQRVREWLRETSQFNFACYSTAAAFCTYFCMYAFRKPFAAGEYAELSLWGMDYKIVLILSQVAGYTLSKFIGIRVIAEMPSGRRLTALVGLIVIAELALIGLGLVPHPYNFPLMFLNGLPLGMIWGIVFSFLEGRQTTEALAAGLSASFIVSSGVVKAVGRHTIDVWGVPEFWMPAVTGMLFLAPLLFFGRMLSLIPPPTHTDELERVARKPMSRDERLALLRQTFLGIAMLVVAHMMLTALRDYRDKFAVEILGAVGVGDAKHLATSEIPVAFAVLLPLGAIMLLRNHRTSIVVLHLCLIVGFLLAGISTIAFQHGILDGFVWYMLVGTGLYLAYVPFHSMLFERLVALMRHPGNAGYLIYIADATGYLSSVAILLWKTTGARSTEPLDFFIGTTYAISILGCLSVVASLSFFIAKAPTPEGASLEQVGGPAETTIAPHSITSER